MLRPLPAHLWSLCPQRSRGRPGGLPHRCSITDRAHTGDALERFQAHVEVAELGEGVDALERFVEVPAVRELVPGGADVADDVGVTLGGEAWDEERGLDAVPVQHLQQPRHADQRTVRLVAHHPRAGGRTRGGVEDG